MSVKDNIFKLAQDQDDIKASTGNFKSKTLSEAEIKEMGLNPSYEYQVFAWSGILTDKTEIDGRHIMATKDHGNGIIERWHLDIPEM